MIESLHSPHIVRVKALLGSRGKKERGRTGLFVAEGLQCLREAIDPGDGPSIETIYVTPAAIKRVEADSLDLSAHEVIEVSEAVMLEMAQTVTPQGILALCHFPVRVISDLRLSGSTRVVFLQEIQDPGNAGTIVRSADAMGIDAVITSPGSVDMYSPKVVRSTAGSLWHIPIYESVSLEEVVQEFPGFTVIALSADSTESIMDLSLDGDIVAVFGNEARGIEDLDASISRVKIPMLGSAESLNLAAAASIVMFVLANQAQ